MSNGCVENLQCITTGRGTWVCGAKGQARVVISRGIHCDAEGTCGESGIVSCTSQQYEVAVGVRYGSWGVQGLLGELECVSRSSEWDERVVGVRYGALRWGRSVR